MIALKLTLSNFCFLSSEVGFMLRKIAKNLTLYETLTKEGDTYTYSFESTFKNHKMVFKLGESFVDHGVDGRDMKVTHFYEFPECLLISLGTIPFATLKNEIPPPPPNFEIHHRGCLSFSIHFK